VEHLLDASCFRSARRVRLADLQSAEVEHVICCTDLTRPAPFYVSSWSAGRIYRRDLDHPIGKRTGTLWRAPELPLAAAVRASAGFPGIPPRRLRLSQFERVEEPKLTINPEPAQAFRSPTVFLSDGGVWNNLATQVRLEDRFFRANERDSGGKTPTVLFVVNALGKLRAEALGGFSVPGWSEIKALIRIANIQNLNTVSPRVEALRYALQRNWAEDKRATGLRAAGRADRNRQQP